MKAHEEDMPPFFEGQEVVANCDHHQGAFKRGDEFRITSVSKKFCGCQGWNVTIGIAGSGRLFNRCHVCKIRQVANPEWLFDSARFSPKIPSIEITALLEEPITVPA